MKLPVINPSSATNPETILRAIKKSAAALCAQSAEPVELRGATAFCNPELANLHDANIVYDLHLPHAASATEIIEEIEDHFGQHKLTCYRWIPAAANLEPELADALRTRGIKPAPTLALTLAQPKKMTQLRNDLQIIPTRTLHRQYHNLQQQAHRAEYLDGSADNLATFKLNALDDPRLDIFSARLNKQVVAAAGIYALGEIGILHEIVTHPQFRQQGIMQTLLSHLLRHAARSQFKTIALETDPRNNAALQLYQSFGFVKLTEYLTYRSATARAAEPT